MLASKDTRLQKPGAKHPPSASPAISDNITATNENLKSYKLRCRQTVLLGICCITVGLDNTIQEQFLARE
jgi:hypothetical protein